MGVFNILQLQMAACPICLHQQDWKVQFKYGDCWMFTYNLYDNLKWGGNDVGEKDASVVLIDGIVDAPCVNCKGDDIYARIFVDDGKLVAASLVIKPLFFKDNPHESYLVIM
jgi:hypothetical protein